MKLFNATLIQKDQKNIFLLKSYFFVKNKVYCTSSNLFLNTVTWERYLEYSCNLSIEDIELMLNTFLKDNLLFFNIFTKKINNILNINFFFIGYLELLEFIFYYWLPKTKFFFFFNYVYLLFNYLYIYFLVTPITEFFYFRFFYDILMYTKFHQFANKYYKMNILYWQRLFDVIDISENYTINKFFNDFFPIFDLFIVITLCFLFHFRNLFLLLRFYKRLVLFNTTGIDFGHESRKRRSSQTRLLSNMLWHLMYKERFPNMRVIFLNFTNQSMFFLTMLTHLKFMKRFKEKTFKFRCFIFRLNQPFGFMKGKKLAIRKRFILKKHIKHQKIFSNLKREFYLYKK